jgi:hypothetical protein
VIGDDVNITEATYQRLIGGYVTAIDILNQRIELKNAHIKELEDKNKTLLEEANTAADKILLLKKELELALHPKK